MAKTANTSGTTKTATVARKGTLAEMLAVAETAVPKAAKSSTGPRAVFTVQQIGAARLSGTGKTVLVTVSGETEDGQRVGGTLWVKP